MRSMGMEDARRSEPLQETKRYFLGDMFGVEKKNH